MSDITVFNGVRVINGKPMMSTKGIVTICEKIGEPKMHKNIIADVRNMLELLDGSIPSHDFEEEKDNRGYTSQFWLNKKLCDTLISGYSIPIRYAIIEEFDKLQTQQKRPESRLEWIQLALEQEKQVLLLESLNQEQAEELVQKEEIIHRLETIKSDKEMLADAYLSSTNFKTLTNFAKEIFEKTDLGRNKLFSILRERRHLTNNNIPSSEMVKRGYFVVKQIKCEDGDFRPQAYITPTGEAWLLKNLTTYLIGIRKLESDLTKNLN